ncbi:vestitone reductase-like [Salvia miltiorrhiza]|uniref:vestitone reductase-like n=1 Tax=Salvia miltiorrhiza TaxID=226208 RepID=UPI0025ABE2E8|nr:vestitone reductase-like [Salvia miltiorrhiza]
MGDENNKGRVCVTGGSGFVGSWMVKRLLQHGYSVNTTIRMHPEKERDISSLRNLEGASERLAVFEADLDRPASFAAAIEGCVGVFHVAHPLDFEEREAEQVKIERVVNGAVGILQACLDAKTVKRVVYCSSTSAAIVINEETGGVDVIDESSWTDVEFVRSLGIFGGPYMVTKTLAEKSVLDFGEKHGLDVVAVLPTWIHGPFICPYLPDSVSIFMSFILGKKECYHQLGRTSVVHVDDVVRAHIHLFENPEAKGRYIISNVEITIEKLHEFLSAKYPEYKLPSTDEFADLKRVTIPSLSSRKLVESGFNFENGLQEMYDGAIKSCKQIGLL